MYAHFDPVACRQTLSHIQRGNGTVYILVSSFAACSAAITVPLRSKNNPNTLSSLSDPADSNHDDASFSKLSSTRDTSVGSNRYYVDTGGIHGKDSSSVVLFIVSWLHPISQSTSCCSQNTNEYKRQKKKTRKSIVIGFAAVFVFFPLRLSLSHEFTCGWYDAHIHTHNHTHIKYLENNEVECTKNGSSP